MTTTTIPHEEMAAIVADATEVKHNPRDYCCQCPQCELERAQAAALARARPTPADDFAGQMSGAVTLTSGKYRR